MKKYTPLIAGLFFVTFCSSTSVASTKQVVDYNLTVADVENAQQAWGEALVDISSTFDASGLEAATAKADAVLDAAYGYDLGPVLFKPTLTVSPQTFRTTKEGALAYFVGNNENFPNDDGFALKGWRSFEIDNEGVYISGDLAITMGKVRLTDKDGNVTEVDKTWAFKKADDNKIKIILHHSSLPHSP